MARRRNQDPFADIRGLAKQKEELREAVLAGKGVLLVGPPGSGKVLLARRCLGLLPPPTTGEEALMETAWASVKAHYRHGDMLPWKTTIPTNHGNLVVDRPFRAPHHTASEAALVGGGTPPRPGEVSLASGGELFLDELPDFRKSALEALNFALRKGEVALHRRGEVTRFPADPAILVGAMNECPCGLKGSSRDAKCLCTEAQLEYYFKRVDPIAEQFPVWIRLPVYDPRA